MCGQNSVSECQCAEVLVLAMFNILVSFVADVICFELKLGF